MRLRLNSCGVMLDPLSASNGLDRRSTAFILLASVSYGTTTIAGAEPGGSMPASTRMGSLTTRCFCGTGSLADNKNVPSASVIRKSNSCSVP